MTQSQIAIATTDQQVRRCFHVMRELRTHIIDEVEFVARKRMSISSYHFRIKIKHEPKP